LGRSFDLFSAVAFGTGSKKRNRYPAFHHARLGARRSMPGYFQSPFGLNYGEEHLAGQAAGAGGADALSTAVDGAALPKGGAVISRFFEVGHRTA
jgi:hypothetical protein